MISVGFQRVSKKRPCRIVANRLIPPEMMRYGRVEAVIAARRLVLEEAYRKHPERFMRQPPEPLRLPAAVWINPPAQTVLGEDSDFVPGRIWYFDDDGRDSADHKNPHPFHLHPSYHRPSYRADNDGEFFLGAVSMGDKLYFASQFLAPIGGVTSTQCISTTDGETWIVEEVCSSPDYSSNPGENSCLGIFTYHPNRGRGLIYSLSANNSYYIEGSNQS